ncbi:15395_t:CDS:2 [Entrophospora sp. SA101]|nr:15395_t:CDS:2 [Entrophospora sp. SA101]
MLYVQWSNDMEIWKILIDNYGSGSLDMIGELKDFDPGNSELDVNKIVDNSRLINI